MSNEDFKKRVQAVYESRDQWIGLIESRLHDLTGLKLSLDKAYPYPFSGKNKDVTSIKTGKKTVVVFDTDKIAEAIGTDNLFAIWQFVLGHIDTVSVFNDPEKQIHIELGDEAEKQLEYIVRKIMWKEACKKKNVMMDMDYDGFGIMDVLGIFSATRHTIEIYAQVIAYYSIKLGIAAEDLAFVVLTHELAHAYTIAGYDINGSRGSMMENLYVWDTDVIEGLAQYYTDAICNQMKDNPEFKTAFDKLSIGQTLPYRWYQDWFNKSKNHEGLRTLMIRYRDKQDAKEFRNYV